MPLGRLSILPRDTVASILLRMSPNDESPSTADVSTAAAVMTAVVSEMLDQRETHLARARAWIASPAFEEVYQDLHHGLIFKILLTLMRKGPSMKMRSSKLRAGYARLAREGELLFAGVVIGNKGLFSDDHDFRYPMAIVASRRQDVESVVQTAVLAECMADAYIEGGSKTMPQCARIIANDTYRAMRRQVLPVEETMGLQAAMFDVRVSMNEMVGDGKPSVFVPLLVHPGGGPFAVVPWPILHGRAVPVKKSKPQPPPLPAAKPRATPPPLPGAKR